jgi:hypothetical protein
MKSMKSSVMLVFLLMAYPLLMTAAVKGGKFQIEIYGSFSALNPEDLNLVTEADRRIQEFLYDDYHRYLENRGDIRSWSKEMTGDYGEISKARPLGFRLKYYWKPSIAFSIGFKYLSKEQDSSLSYQYTRDFYWYQRIDRREYSLYTISARASALLVGIHLVKKLNSFIDIEGYLGGGPLFARCSYASQWRSEWWEQGTGYSILLFEEEGMLEQKGSGTGVAVDGGIRLNFHISRNLGLFMAGGYAYQSVGNISGPGKERRGDYNAEWEGDWGIKGDRLQTDWGTLEVEYPTSYWQEGVVDGSQKVRDFKLDLSGFQLRAGIFFRF